MSETANINVRFSGQGSQGLVTETKNVERSQRDLGESVDKTTTKTKKFKRASDQASKSMRLSGESMRALGQAARLTVGALTALGVGFAAMTRSGLKTVDSLAKTSDKLGVATEQLSGLRLAAELTGVEVTKFDTGLQRLVRRTAEAASGMGEAQAAFEVLGLEASQLVKLSPDQVLGKVADAMNQIESQSQRVQLAFKLFDTEGVALVNTLNLGSDGLNRFTDLARRLGIAVDRDTAAAVERANDSLTIMGKAFEGLGTQLAVRFAPAIGGVALTIVEMIDKFGGVGEISNRVFKSMSSGFKFIGRLIDGFNGALAYGRFLFAELIEGVNKLRLGLVQAERPWNLLFGSPEDIRETEAEIAEIKREIEAAQKVAAEFAIEAHEKFKSAFSDNSEVLDEFVNNYAGNVNDLKKLLDDLGESQRKNIVDTTDVINKFAIANENAALRTATAWASATDNAFGRFSQLFAGAGGGIGGLGAILGGGAGGSGSGGGGGGLNILGAVGGLVSALPGGLTGGVATASNLYSRLFGFTSPITNYLDTTFGNLAARPGASLLGGFAGSFVGNSIGEALFGKTAQSNIGSTIGGIAGSFFGPLGTGAGAAIGSLLDVAFGGDDFLRSNTGFLAGGVRQGARGRRFGDVVTGASGLQFQTFTRRGDSDQSDALLDVALQLDSVLTQLSRAAGATVDFANTQLAGTAADTINRPGSFFGQVNANTAEDAATRFVIAWLDEVNEQLPQRVRRIVSGVEQTAEALVSAFEAAINIDQLIGIEVVRDTDEALRILGESNGTLLEQYRELTDEVLNLNDQLDGTADSYVALNAALTEQKTIAVELAAAYRIASSEIDSLLGGTIERIRESVLTEEELYNKRRNEIAELSSQLASAVDPNEIAGLVSQIDRLTQDAFGLLDENQRQELAQGFVDTLTQVNAIAQGQINSGLGSLSASDQNINQAIDIQLAAQNAAVMQGAANTMQNAANTFANAIENGVLTIVIPGIGETTLDLAALAAGSTEVNI